MVCFGFEDDQTFSEIIYPFLIIAPGSCYRAEIADEVSDVPDIIGADSAIISLIVVVRCRINITHIKICPRNVVIAGYLVIGIMITFSHTNEKQIIRN